MIDLYNCLSSFHFLASSFRPSLQYSACSSCLNSLTIQQKENIPTRLSTHSFSHPAKHYYSQHSLAYCTKAPSLHPLLLTPNSTAAAPQSSP
jgi:hypothetical protein